MPKILKTDLIDEVITVTNDDAIAMARRLPKEEGLLVGISSRSGRAHAALQLAKNPKNEGKLIVAIVPSGGEQYLSTLLFDGFRKEAMETKTSAVPV